MSFEELSQTLLMLSVREATYRDNAKDVLGERLEYRVVEGFAFRVETNCADYG